VGKIKQINTDDIKKYIRRNYMRANVWINGVQIMRNGRILNQKGRDYFKGKVEAHKKWMKKKKIKKADAIGAADAV